MKQHTDIQMSDEEKLNKSIPWSGDFDQVKSFFRKSRDTNKGLDPGVIATDFGIKLSIQIRFEKYKFNLRY